MDTILLGMRWQTQCILGELYVRKEYQNKGYGKAILEHYMGIWKENRMEKAILNVDLKNWNAIRFWVKKRIQ